MQFGEGGPTGPLREVPWPAHWPRAHVENLAVADLTPFVGDWSDQVSMIRESASRGTRAKAAVVDPLLSVLGGQPLTMFWTEAAVKPGDGETWRFVDQEEPDEILAM